MKRLSHPSQVCCSGLPWPHDNQNLINLAGKFHGDLPEGIRDYLKGRGVTNEVIDLNLIGWNGWRITIPIFNREGELLFFKQARDPEDKNESPKMIAWPKGHMELYGWDNLIEKPSEIIICEGEFDGSHLYLPSAAPSFTATSM